MKKAVNLEILFFSILASSTLISTTVFATPDENKNTFDFPLGFGITASPAINISTRHDDNIFLQDRNTTSSWITELAPSIILAAGEGANYYTAKYKLAAGRYHSSRNDDYVDHMFQLNSHNEFNHRNKIELAVDYLKLHENRGTGISDGGASFSSTPDKYRDIDLEGTYFYGSDNATGRIEVNASHLDKKYINHRSRTRGFDRKENEVGGTFFYKVMPKTSLLFEAKHKNIEYINEFAGVASLDGDENTYQVGVMWDTTAKTTGRAQFGRTHKSFDSSQRKSSNFPSWEVGVNWELRSYSVFDFSTSSSADETNGTGNFIEQRSYVASWQHAWSERLSSSVQTSFTNDDYSASTRNDDIKDYLLGMDYLFRRGVKFGVEYSYENRNSNITNLDYNDNIFMLSAKIGI